ncbi:MAG: DEAD/DEAH box helicase, partial [Bacilli bacterium]|nr:DEAD/DEAH box helicase [Bacilli bacterium]
REEIDHEKLNQFVDSLPFSLTRSQRSAIRESLKDMEGDSLMYRLLQGDVGTGKTLVAAILLYANYLRGSQGALMAPTESLANQHFETLKKIFKGTKVQVVLLTGKMDAVEKKFSAIDLADGSADIAVGTHALFSKAISFNGLGLAIIDEQHKFGVNQRTLLAQKGEHADVLLMSATPIPRTLSMTIYGDLDVSTLTEFPSQHRNVKTMIIRPTAAGVSKAVDASLSGNHRVYVVAPQIEMGESKSASVKEVYDLYEKRYPGKVALLHGKMNGEEKEAALLAFRTGLCPILVSTSVIEVGIDVPAANLMLVYDPSHFALSSLHQLRGRIGRDGSKALCLLLYEGNDPDDLDKLKVLEDSEDGFHIAEEDLRRRGPGEVFGYRQSGLPSFAFINIVNDFRVFECARDDASYMLENPDDPSFRSLIRQAQQESDGVGLK